jgi:hypothetical protein
VVLNQEAKAVTSVVAALGGIIWRIGIAVTIANPVGGVDNTAGEIRVFLG